LFRYKDKKKKTTHLIAEKVGTINTIKGGGLQYKCTLFFGTKKITPPQNEKKGGGRDNQKASLNYER
jgi:hypothetical protein